MQTRTTHFMHSERHLIHAIGGALAGCLLLSATGCAAPQLETRVETNRAANPCSRAYRSANEAQNVVAGHNPRLMRFLAATTAGSQWTEVAAACPQRFAQGTIHAAQARHLAHMLAPAVGGTYSESAAATHRGGLDGLTQLHADTKVLLAAVLAEDRAGFAAEVLAARGVSNATLALSDDHKATASRLFSLASAAGNIKDPRQKIYSVKQLLANQDTIIDAATGLRVPTMAAVEIDCAREEITGVEGQNSQSTQALQPAQQSQRGSASSSTDDSASTDGLRALSFLTASRMEQAFDLGYPSYDAALFA
ncbi:hypothetical protein [Bifidobacterium tibiigranuli]|jgi:hypothetical protein|uniref:hypothetical protein n=1 Tax=Bifidobacterium tibiigranuli TaxID=2172043 RepID=UPI0026F2338A|nr:hypothetical protein [Bifidobacterium tibiigranuli]MCI1649777.1 hypothetical protein [Bifidobacterium tibiigranuli]MCI2186632.1 hypothetical protein [Bifidobacterium tibiigranuli]MCI2204238.1 hypothetical protein [Bifidobacterium tibiigranuli]